MKKTKKQTAWSLMVSGARSRLGVPPVTGRGAAWFRGQVSQQAKPWTARRSRHALTEGPKGSPEHRAREPWQPRWIPVGCQRLDSSRQGGAEQIGPPPGGLRGFRVESAPPLRLVGYRGSTCSTRFSSIGFSSGGQPCSTRGFFCRSSALACSLVWLHTCLKLPSRSGSGWNSHTRPLR